METASTPDNTFMDTHGMYIIYNVYLQYTRIFINYSDGLKLRMPFWKCHFELYARRFGNLECLPTPCFPNMIKNFNFPDILQVFGLFLLQSDRLTACLNKSSWPKPNKNDNKMRFWCEFLSKKAFTKTKILPKAEKLIFQYFLN